MPGILEKMGVKTKEEVKKWREQERKKQEAINKAFTIEYAKIEISSQEKAEEGHDQKRGAIP